MPPPLFDTLFGIWYLNFTNEQKFNIRAFFRVWQPLATFIQTHTSQYHAITSKSHLYAKCALWSGRWPWQRLQLGSWCDEHRNRRFGEAVVHTHPWIIARMSRLIWVWVFSNFTGPVMLAMVVGSTCFLAALLRVTLACFAAECGFLLQIIAKLSVANVNAGLINW